MTASNVSEGVTRRLASKASAAPAALERHTAPARARVKSRDRMIPWYFVMFFVGLAVIDGIFVTLALKTHTGTVTRYPYEQGLAYNRVIEASSAQEALGWKGTLTHSVTAPNRAEISFSVVDAGGAAVALTHADAKLTRPARAGLDFTVPLERTDDGIWHANVTFPEPGLWEIRVYAKDAAHSFQQSKRIVIE